MKVRNYFYTNTSFIIFCQIEFYIERSSGINCYKTVTGYSILVFNSPGKVLLAYTKKQSRNFTDFNLNSF